MFRRGQVVEIIRVDEDDDPQWLGLRCEVADAYIDGTVGGMLIDKPHTKLVPLSDRPDAKILEVDPRSWFFWPTVDLGEVNNGE